MKEKPSKKENLETLEDSAGRISLMDPGSIEWADAVILMMANMRGEDPVEMYQALSQSLERDLREESGAYMSPIYLKGALDGFDFCGTLARQVLPINVEYMAQYNLTRAVLIKFRHSFTS